jgi:hypothetical protein
VQQRECAEYGSLKPRDYLLLEGSLSLTNNSLSTVS